MSRSVTYLSGIGVLTFILFAVLAWTDPVPTGLLDFFLPGSQPNQSGNLENPDKCDNCHGGYDQAVEPAYNWRGSMMSQAARDPLFYACLAISNQDAPEAGDICIRCHSPKGWLEGRSLPTDASSLTSADREGVQCDFCHHMVKPTPLGVNPYPGDPDYTNDTYPRDQAYLATVDSIPGWTANGMYVADSNNGKRGPFVDAVGRHQQWYSPFHSDAGHCGTCHDVSNPAFTRDPSGAYAPNSFGEPAPDFDLRSMFPIERTFSEWSVSSYNTPGGVYAPQFGGNKAYVSTCQDCHLRDVTGKGGDMNNAPVRTNLPLHDMTGGNTFIPNMIDDTFPGEAQLDALAAGVQRAAYMLQNAATLGLTVVPDGSGYLATVRVTNETGHKLPSGYPEGRRIWLNVRAYDTSGTLIYESGAYDTLTAVLASDPDIKVYEIKPGISTALAPIVNVPAGPSFHFVQNDTVYEDNRIPPRGFMNASFDSVQSPPVGYTYADRQYWDDSDYVLPDSTAWVDVTLYYQTLSKEYVEFLRDENTTNNWGNILYNLWLAHGRSRPEVMATASYTVVWPIELRARLSGGGVLLLWTAYPGAAEYWVYEVVNDAYFTPGLAPGYEHRVAVVPGGTTSWSSSTGVGDSANNASYLVLAVDAAEQELARSNRAGEFDFDM
jgi:mono/diheme cytochrome c family protein